MSKVFKVIFGKFKSFFIRHIKSDAFIISNKLAQTIQKERTFISNDRKLLKQKHTCIHGEYQVYLNV